MPIQHLEQWLSCHQQQFIAHAIWQDNVNELFTSGRLEPAELQLRKKQQVSCEMGMYGDRKQISISSFVDGIKEQIFSPVVDVCDVIDLQLLQAITFGFITEEELEQHLPELRKPNPSCIINQVDGSSFRLTRTQPSGHPFFSYSIEIKLPWAVNNGDTKRLSTYLPAQHVAIDNLSKDPIDNRLSIIWESNKDRCNKRELFRYLLSLRRAEIQSSSISMEIRASLNAISWGYGSVVVLRGNFNPMLSVGNTAYSDNDFERKEEEIKFIKGREMFLLTPFENGGAGLCLDLSQEDTLIIGPRIILSTFQERMEKRSIHFCHIEDMNDAQLDFFNVPETLRPIPSSATPAVDGAPASSPHEVTGPQKKALTKLSIFVENSCKKEFLNIMKAKIVESGKSGPSC